MTLNYLLQKQNNRIKVIKSTAKSNAFSEIQDLQSVYCLLSIFFYKLVFHFNENIQVFNKQRILFS